MKMKLLVKVSIILVVCIIANTAFAQQTTINNLYKTDRFIYNPANTGLFEYPTCFANIRNQLSGIDGSAKSAIVGMHSKISDQMGIGGMLNSYKVGIEEKLFVNLTYSYKVKFSEIQDLRFGVSAGLESRQINNNVIMEDMSELPTMKEGYNNVGFGASFGVKYIYNNKLFVDIAAPQLFERNNDFKKEFLASVSYQFADSAQRFNVEPIVLMRRLPYTKPQFDVGVYGTYKNDYWLGLTYRTGISIILSSGMSVKNIDIMYAYEAYLGNLKDFNAGTFEIGVAYNIGKVKDEPIEETIYVTETDSTAEDTNEASDAIRELRERTKKISNLQSQIDSLNKVYNTKTQKVSNDSTLLYDSRSIETGNYVIINTFRNLNEAKATVAKMRDNKMKGFVLYNKSKKSYYIYSEYFKKLEPALKEMEKLRTKGFNSWVLIY